MKEPSLRCVDLVINELTQNIKRSAQEVSTANDTVSDIELCIVCIPLIRRNTTNMPIRNYFYLFNGPEST